MEARVRGDAFHPRVARVVPVDAPRLAGGPEREVLGNRLGRCCFLNHFRLSLRNPQTAHAHAGSKFIICNSLAYLTPPSKIWNAT